MKHIDKIIKYLSGEMLPDESDRFKNDISKDSELRDEFESISSIWKEIQKHLQLKEGSGTENREELIAEILAEHDIEFYGTKAETKREEAFRNNLKKVMIEAEKPVKKKKLSPRIYSMVSLMAAALITALVIIMNPAPDLDELTEAYYQPGSDPVFEKVSSTSRSDAGSAMALFIQGKYELSSSIAFQEITKNPDLPEMKLLYALSQYETGDFSEAESYLLTLIEEGNSETVRAANWYLALIYLKTDNNSKARSKLEKLISVNNPYQKRAGKLLKLMK